MGTTASASSGEEVCWVRKSNGWEVGPERFIWSSKQRLDQIITNLLISWWPKPSARWTFFDMTCLNGVTFESLGFPRNLCCCSGILGAIGGVWPVPNKRPPMVTSSEVWFGQILDICRPEPFINWLVVWTTHIASGVDVLLICMFEVMLVCELCMAPEFNFQLLLKFGIFGVNWICIGGTADKWVPRPVFFCGSSAAGSITTVKILDRQHGSAVLRSSAVSKIWPHLTQAKGRWYLAMWTRRAEFTWPTPNFKLVWSHSGQTGSLGWSMIKWFFRQTVQHNSFLQTPQTFCT